MLQIKNSVFLPHNLSLRVYSKLTSKIEDINTLTMLTLTLNLDVITRQLLAFGVFSSVQKKKVVARKINQAWAVSAYQDFPFLSFFFVKKGHHNETCSLFSDCI